MDDNSCESVVQFHVPGVPAPAGSKRAFYIAKLKRAVVTDACKRTKPWQADVKARAFEAMNGRKLLTGPVSLDVEFQMPRPKHHYGAGRNAGILRADAPQFHTSPPDTTKLLRAIEDAMTQIVWRDDAEVAVQTARKVYADGGPGAIIRVSAIPLGAATGAVAQSKTPSLPFVSTDQQETRV